MYRMHTDMTMAAAIRLSSATFIVVATKKKRPTFFTPAVLVSACNERSADLAAYY